MMNDQVPLERWNQSSLALMQALLGAVSPNFRMVALDNSGGTWKLMFVLEVESEADREEIDDIAAEFESLHENSIHYVLETTITDGLISWPSPPVRVVFRRKEKTTTIGASESPRNL